MTAALTFNRVKDHNKTVGWLLQTEVPLKEIIIMLLLHCILYDHAVCDGELTKYGFWDKNVRCNLIFLTWIRSSSVTL